MLAHVGFGSSHPAKIASALRAQWHISPCPFHIAVLPGCPLCETIQNPSAHTYFSYLTREPSARRAQGPPWYSPTSASVLPGPPPYREPWNHPRPHLLQLQPSYQGSPSMDCPLNFSSRQPQLQAAKVTRCTKSSQGATIHKTISSSSGEVVVSPNSQKRRKSSKMGETQE